MPWTAISESTKTWTAPFSSATSQGWWHLSGVSDFDSSYSLTGVDFRLVVTDTNGMLVSAETARAVIAYDSQISRP